MKRKLLCDGPGTKPTPKRRRQLDTLARKPRQEQPLLTRDDFVACVALDARLQQKKSFRVPAAGVRPRSPPITRVQALCQAALDLKDGPKKLLCPNCLQSQAPIRTNQITRGLDEDEKYLATCRNCGGQMEDLPS